MEITSLHKLSTWPGLSMALTLPVSVDAVGYAAVGCAMGLLEEIEDARALLQQDACKYKEANLLKSDDVDVVGHLLIKRLTKY